MVRSCSTKLKRLISDLSLVHFDPAVEIVVASDASEYGTIAVMLLKYKAVNMEAVVHAPHLPLTAENITAKMKKKLKQLFLP